MMDRESPLFKHFVRYAAWWGDPANANVLDELDRARELFESTHPRQGHQTEDDKTRWAQAWPEGGESMQPPTLLNRMRELELLRQLGPVDVHYSLLDSLKDPTAEPSSTHVLRILRSKHTVAKVSKELNNCALSYATWVERGGYVLVAIFDVTGKAKALAGYRPGAESWDHEPVEKNNVSASGEMCVLFDDYLSVLTAWSRQTYPDGLPDDATATSMPVQRAFRMHSAGEPNLPTPKHTMEVLDRIVQPGEHRIEFYAHGGYRIERGKMSPAAANFWSRHRRYELLRPDNYILDVLEGVAARCEGWDEDEHGTPPKKGDAAWQGLYVGEHFGIVLSDVELSLDSDDFAIRLADLQEVDVVDLRQTSGKKFYPELGPLNWECCTEIAHNCDSRTVTIKTAMSLRELLRRGKLVANVYQSDGSLHPFDTIGSLYVKDLSFGGECIYWDDHSEETDEWFTMEPPVIPLKPMAWRRGRDRRCGPHRTNHRRTADRSFILTPSWAD